MYENINAGHPSLEFRNITINMFKNLTLQSSHLVILLSLINIKLETRWFLFRGINFTFQVQRNQSLNGIMIFFTSLFNEHVSFSKRV